jgi:putative NADH-flavin reductase
MAVLLLGASGQIGQRIGKELLDRDYTVTGVSRTGKIEGIAHSNFRAVTGDATDSDMVAELAAGHDAVASALGSSDGKVNFLPEMARAVIEGLRKSDVERLVWTGGVGGLYVGPETQFIETDDFPDHWVPTAQAHIDALEIIREADDLDWSYIAPAAMTQPGKRTGGYRTAERQPVVDENGESRISMEDFAVAIVDELEKGEAIHTQLGVGY